MLLQQLAEYGRRLEGQPPFAHAYAPVRYEIHLDAAGGLLTPEPVDLANPTSPAGALRPVPKVRRTGNTLRPLLLADHAEYTLGLSRRPGHEGDAWQRHDAYLELLAACVRETHDPGAAAVLAFLRDDPLAHLRLAEDHDRSAKIEFRVDGRLVTQQPEVQRFWAMTHTPGADAAVGQCLVCRQHKPLLDRPQNAVRGIPASHPAGAALVTASGTAFASCGLEASRVAPLCAACASDFMRGLNDLLDQERTCLRIGAAAFLFWTPTATGFPLARWFADPDPDEVRALIDSTSTAATLRESDATPLYVLALSANQSRAVVRDWISTTVGAFRHSLGLWFQRQSISTAFEPEPPPLKLLALAAATVRDPTVDLPVETAVALVRSAVTGAPLPHALLQQAVLRCRAERAVPRARAALLRLCLLSRRPDAIPGELATLQTDLPEPAYQCGRLLALIELIQRASANVAGSATRVNRHYAAASVSPAAIFPVLLRGAESDLAAFPASRRATAKFYRRELGELLAALPALPPPLDLREQALCSLGYYHQRVYMSVLVRRRAPSMPEANGQSASDFAPATDTDWPAGRERELP